MRNGLMQCGVLGVVRDMVRDMVQNGVGRASAMRAGARRGTTAAFAFLLAATLAAPLAADPLRTVEAEAGKAKVQGGAQKIRGRGKAVVPGGPNDETAIWWNDPGIQKALSLEDDQREKMQRLLETYRETVPPPNRMETFHELLVQGDWEQAQSENEKLVANAATAIRMRGRLKVDVLSVLTEKQRKVLIDRFPRLIYKPWTRAMRGSAAR